MSIEHQRQERPLPVRASRRSSRLLRRIPLWVLLTLTVILMFAFVGQAIAAAFVPEGSVWLAVLGIGAPAAALGALFSAVAIAWSKQDRELEEIMRAMHDDEDEDLAKIWARITSVRDQVVGDDASGQPDDYVPAKRPQRAHRTPRHT